MAFLRAWSSVIAPASLALIVGCSSGEPAPSPYFNGSYGSGGAQTIDEGQTGGSTNGAGGAVVEVGKSPTAIEAGEAMGRGFNLGQMFENTQHQRTLAEASVKIDAYYERGFRNVRIPVTWTEEVGGDLLVLDPAVGNVDREHPRLAEIEGVVDYALSKPGLFVVINAHHEHALKTEARAAALEQLWKDIADIFKDRDHRLIFEFLNEPHKDDGSAMAVADVRTMTGLAYDQVRAVDQERIVMIGGNQWFAAGEVPKVWTDLEPVGGGTDPFVMASFHHYNPWTFCGDNQGSYDDNWTELDLSGPMDTMKKWADSVGGGMPVYIGEWGVGWGSVYSTMSCNNVRLWYSSFDAQFAAPRGQPTAVWDDGGWFEVFSHQSDGFKSNLIDCIEGQCAWEGEERFNEGCL